MSKMTFRLESESQRDIAEICDYLIEAGFEKDLARARRAEPGTFYVWFWLDEEECSVSAIVTHDPDVAAAMTDLAAGRVGR